MEEYDAHAPEEGRFRGGQSQKGVFLMSEAKDRFTLTVGRLSLAGYRWETARPKAAVCIIHGIGEHAGRYAHVAARLNMLGYSAYAVDLPGHGQSPGPRGHAGGTQALMRMVDSLVIYAKAGQAPGPVLPVFVMGHSMGGNIALSHRLYRPDTGVRGYIASAPWLETDNKLLRDQFALCRLLAFFAPGLLMDTGLDETQLCANPAPDAPDAAKPDPLCHSKISARTGVDRERDARRVLACAAQDGLSPVFLFHGANDTICLPAAAERFQKSAGGRCVSRVWPGLRHETMNEAAWQTVVDAAVEWLNTRMARL